MLSFNFHEHLSPIVLSIIRHSVESSCSFITTLSEYVPGLVSAYVYMIRLLSVKTDMVLFCKDDISVQKSLQ